MWFNSVRKQYVQKDASTGLSKEEDYSSSTFPSTNDLFSLLSKRVVDGELIVTNVASVVTMDTLHSCSSGQFHLVCTRPYTR